MYFNQLGWIPLVKDALAGYNTSLLAYGQVYNGHIVDLLDPMQRNLKGLSSRKVGSTGVNSKSSRSHGVFTCIIKSWRKSKLQPYTDDLMNKSTDRARTSLLLKSIQLGKSGAYAKRCSEKELEAERQRWTEMESEWISLTDELRINLESIR
nr:kinesin-like protein KIN-12F [Ipomoea batatas]